MRRDERGALAVWVAVAIPAFIVVVGLGVDFSGHSAALQEAHQVAAQAARIGGQQVHIASGGNPALNGLQAVTQARSYAVASGYQAQARVTGGRFEVEVSGRYDCLFLGIIGINSLPVNTQAIADPLAVLDGGEI